MATKVKRAFIEEATVTPWGMWMGRHLEMQTASRGLRRILIFERTWDWGGPIELGAAKAKAVARLAQIGRRATDGGWWQDIVGGDERGVQLRHPVTAETWARLDDIQQAAAIPHLYAVLEHVPGSTAGWRD